MRSQQIKEYSLGLLEHTKHTLDILDKKYIYLDPFLILKRGYSVTYYNGKAMKDPKVVPERADLKPVLAGGILKSKTT